jgi:hypothetical protein
MTAKARQMQLWMVADPSVDERLVLDLALAIHNKREPYNRVVTCEAQVEALAYFNEHGFEKALERLWELGGMA